MFLRVAEKLARFFYVKTQGPQSKHFHIFFLCNTELII